MTTFAERMSALALRQIESKGEIVTFETHTESYADQKVTLTDPVPHPIKVGILPYKERDVDGDGILDGDMRMWIRAEDLTFDAEELVDGLTFSRENGESWTLVGDATVYPIAGANIAYKMQVRGVRK